MKKTHMDYYRFKNKSKFKILNELVSCDLIFVVPQLCSFLVQEFLSSKYQVINNALNVVRSDKLAIRSSAADEDGNISSSAGEYVSILNVPSTNMEQILGAVDAVVSSYDKKRNLLPDDEVIIQEMVLNTTISGVVFTYDLNTGAPYYVINYDDQSGLTDTVTSGDGEHANRTLYVHRNSVDVLRSERFSKLLLAVQELEQVMDNEFLDIEFALDKNLTPYLLQVRSITTKPNWNRVVAKRIDATLEGVQAFVAERFQRLDRVYGKTTVLGQMPDWNPVEMIGRAPRALAASLYETLITDHVWSDARSMMGYATPNGQPLMIFLAGQPFIDTRLSFHSYLPKAISPIIAEKLVDHWIDRLKSFPELHDKIEFDVAITTYSLDMDERVELLIGDVLTEDEKMEFKQEHRKQTQYLIKSDGRGSLKQAINKINTLESKQKQLSNTDQPCLSSLFTMIDDCIQLGTTPFSILARHGFIARNMLLSLENKGIITHDEVNQIQASIHTVASDLVDDLRTLQIEGGYSEFMERYGHLRPGTYDVMSHRYDQMTDFFSGIAPTQLEQCKSKFEFSQIQLDQLSDLLEENCFNDLGADELLNYVYEATIGRELGKFIFTRSVSDMLEMIANFAEKNGLSRSEISHVPLSSILKLAKNTHEQTAEEILRDISEQEVEKHEISAAIRLPQLLTDQAGVYVVPFQVSHPNFITRKKIIAPCQTLNRDSEGICLNGKVVLIEGADPGFDWIFSQKIAGLITKYGGANSHMAIRCAEFGIPAAIGCGEQYFDMLLKTNKVHLDCSTGLINLLH